jgi:hypothetical protein
VGKVQAHRDDFRILPGFKIMSTIRELELFREQHRTEQPPQSARENGLGEMWSDALATLAIVTLASTIVFEAIRLLL